MSAPKPAEVSTLFERCFADGDLEGLMALYEDDAVFPTPHGTSTGHDEIRTTHSRHISIPAPSWCSASPLSSVPGTWR